MTATTIIGFPRIGEKRELKFATEKYFKNKISQAELQKTARELRKHNWELLARAGIDGIPSNDFSYYDQTLDTAFLFNLVPQNVQALPFSPLDKYFALARGYQGKEGNVLAWPMKKWFNTNYHYLVPQLNQDTQFKLSGDKIFKEFAEAKELGIITRPVLVGPFTLLKLSEYQNVTVADFVNDAVAAYQAVFERLTAAGAQWIQLDEPFLVKDLTTADQQLFNDIYRPLLAAKGKLKVLCQTYFGDVRDIYNDLISLPFDGLGLDFVEGKQTRQLVSDSFPDDKVLFAGIVNGKNIWRNNYVKSLARLQATHAKNIVVTTSCSLLHVPITVTNESFAPAVKEHFAFAVEKLGELKDIAAIYGGHAKEKLTANQALFAKPRVQEDAELHAQIANLKEEDFVRQPARKVREKIQKKEFNLPLLPTTTIGSFPQTKEVRSVRRQFRRHEIDQEQYDDFIKGKIDDWLKWQEEVGLDVLVHGEFERNDMVEYFGQHLSGYLFSKNAWVQSYGTRCVKPPIIWGDVKRRHPITIKWSKYAQSQTKKLVKGMLTGPVTILNWSFPREDISLKESTLQLALAIQGEVLDLEANGIKIIQIDEAALREKLPLRKSDWYSEYLNWAIPAFRLVHSKVKPETQIHTHMCYSEFSDIIPAIDAMDADVISFEASRSNLEILDALKKQHFETEVGPGVYDIHSPRVPSVDEVETTINRILAKIAAPKVWINPDCGLKTRGVKETKASLTNVIAATRAVRRRLKEEGD
ncbi:5-methyltetrahydropteroyltriglutamate--homocysteine S-methyltransferase [Limosilactobacillus pontis]|uniref:5-methyltetrahydropteroyltriglutamate-- homocysteine S-methyltransferase n=1 Tax=Limosilactobacillus pontis TaxID=35787 RepID=UPI00224644DD|nr:5-methyltetrahydropteroyltriglutamate--homocysteine S-methyltransferase [Limosilactobacillus pontis]MCX2186650.1 5-methyltetrahydropteroyltriglutamate--homocysteine S-methyltransferase [Limosilactobacillus pontis]MCX2188337.1 5-methyltetrahydropteroyltriglutamate--homocysteine S-methyltransferase [Limosilactobacillus pontis]